MRENISAVEEDWVGQKMRKADKRNRHTSDTLVHIQCTTGVTDRHIQHTDATHRSDRSKRLCVSSQCEIRRNIFGIPVVFASWVLPAVQSKKE